MLTSGIAFDQSPRSAKDGESHGGRDDTAGATPRGGGDEPDAVLLDGTTLDLGGLRENVEYLVEGGVRLIYPCGNTGELPSLSLEEWTAVVSTVVEAVDGLPSSPGGRRAPAQALEQRERASDLGADGMLCMPTTGPYLSEEGVVAYYRRLLEDAVLPGVIYRRPPYMTDDGLHQLVGLDAVAGVKYVGLDTHAFAALVRGGPAELVWTCGMAERYAPYCMSPAPSASRQGWPTSRPVWRWTWHPRSELVTTHVPWSCTGRRCRSSRFGRETPTRTTLPPSRPAWTRSVWPAGRCGLPFASSTAAPGARSRTSWRPGRWRADDARALVSACVAESSAIRAVRRRAVELEASGRSIVHFEIGEPDFDSPPEAKAAAMAALTAGRVHYTANHGEPELLEAISEKLAHDNDLHYDPVGEIVVTTGGAEGLLDTTMAFVGPGDEVIIPEPAWPHYRACVLLAGGVPVGVPTRASEGHVPDPGAVANAITPRTGCS